MTLHDLAIDWVAAQVGGKVTHTGVGLGSRIYSVGRMEPDVVENKRKIPHCHIWHEVEVLHLSKQKMRNYGGYKNKKVLWIVLPKGASKTFSIRVIEQQDFDEFRMLRCGLEGDFKKR